MYVSLDWLKDFAVLPDDLDAATLAHELTLRTVEVEGATDLAARFPADLVAGRVVDGDVRDGRGVVTVDAGTGSVVEAACRGPVAVGALTAVALSGLGSGGGATVVGPHDIGLGHMYAADVAGRPFDLAAPDATVTGVEAARPGTPVASLLGWDDIVLEIDNKSLTNRPDLWAHQGIARELAAIYSTELKELPRRGLDPARLRDDLVGAVDRSACRRFTLLEIRLKDGRAPASPLPIRSRLARIGQRAIGFYADLTNYVMFSVGQPAHAYDRSTVTLPLGVRRSTGEPAQAFLNGETIELAAPSAVIADPDRAVGIAGTVGSVATQVTPATASVLLEMANFEPSAVRRSTLDLRVRTDASARFEKGIDTQAVDRGRGYLLSLIERYDPGAEVVAHQDVALDETERAVVETDLSYLNERMGTTLTASDVERLLAPLGFDTAATGNHLRVVVPTWRSTGDVSIPNDILEEVARMIGYDNLPPSTPTITLRPAAPPSAEALERSVREFLALRVGAQEVLSYPWVTDRFLEATGWMAQPRLAIEGAPSEDRRSLRPSLVPNLLAAVEVNLSHTGAFRLFEIGSVYLDGPRTSTTDHDEMLPPQPRCVAVVLVGDDLSTEFRSAAGAIEGLRRACGIRDLAFDTTDGVPWGDAVAMLRVTSGGVGVGHLAAVDLGRTVELAADRRVVCFELQLSGLRTTPSRDNRYTPFSHYPSTSVDVSLIVPDGVRWDDIATAARKDAGPYVTRVEFVDEFRGRTIEPGTRSVTLRLVMSAPDRTLVGADKAAARDEVAQQLVDELGAVIRE